MSARIATRFLTLKPALGNIPAWPYQQCLRWDNNRSSRGLFLGNRRLYHGTSLRYGQKSGSEHDGASGVKGRIRSRKGFILAATTGTLGGTLLFFYDDVKHAYQAAERTGRVVAGLLICINELSSEPTVYAAYRVTLNKETDTEEERTALLNACHQRCADRTLKVLEKNGSIFIKLGQHLSSLGYLLPLEWTTTFIPLQDKCPVSSFESVQEMFLKDTGHTIDEIFSSFDPMPIGAASLAQVHVAVLRETGQKVAVKVQHPTLQEWAPLDLSLTRFTFSSLKRVFPEYDLEWLAREMDFSLPQELDFQMEAENARVAREYFSKRTTAPLVIPKVIWAKKRLLVMEFISGHRPDDLEFLDSNNIDRDEVSASLAHIFNEMIFGDGAPLHCDPHGGNIAICKNNTRKRGPNFDIVLYDHGLYRTIPKEMRINYAKLWLAVINADEKEMRKYAYEVAGVTDAEFPLFASAITGRDYTVLAQNQVASSRSSEEKESITTALGDGMLQELVSLLGKVPRVMLLILKTNDLTRNLDENLHTRHGPVRTFLILAKYATCAVFSEEMELISKQGSIFWPPNFLRFLQAWVSYLRVEIKLEIYENWLSLRNRLGLTNH
ncbi:ABC1 family protein [Nannizzia gypsea CBS 118893]|uniref:ABC1 family protein n=1 Tax=Arthroderma gypseum (strain ATCC MYA-4604 / CBS 118893) TaxID=535722 RepID=E5R3F7_ARTGP|nr:ABC1 family protein [Nannizzia gypsea CBS 118893]EFQ98756.1 ABC1 family protein [Nannizzia gypsea CBS 118893]